MKFFLAYSRNDRDYAATLSAEIERQGGAVIDPETSLIPGDHWGTALRTMIESAGAAILVLPRDGASGANNAIFEAGAAKALGKQVFVIARSANDRELPTEIADLAILSAERKPVGEVAETLVRQAG